MRDRILAGVRPAVGADLEPRDSWTASALRAQLVLRASGGAAARLRTQEAASCRRSIPALIDVRHAICRY